MKTAWGLKDKTTGEFSCVVMSRSLARENKFPNETIVKVLIKEAVVSQKRAA